MAVSNDDKTISKGLRDVFQGTPKYARYADEQEESTIDRLSCADSPWEGISSHATFETCFSYKSVSFGSEIRNIVFATGKIVAWLLLVPISDEEFGYAETRGMEALQSLFEKEEIDIFNLLRKSVV